MTHYNVDEIKENDEGWLFYDAAFKCWKSIYQNLTGNSILDIGCASGTMIALIKIFNPDLKLTGFEGSEASKIAWQKRNIDVSVGNIYSMPFSDKSFDTVYSSHVLEHCENPEFVIKESIRLARKRIIHIVPDGDVSNKNFGSPHLHIFNRKNFMELFKDIFIVSYKSIPDYHMNSLMVVCDIK